MWIARDKDGTLWLTLLNEPERNEDGEYWFLSFGEFNSKEYIELDNSLFPELKWEDEPVEVMINNVKPSKPAFPWRWCEEHTYNEREREVWLAGWDKCREYVKKEFGIKV